MEKKGCVLIVDDAKGVRETLRLVFEYDGYAVITATSCAEAIRRLEDGSKFNAVITDLNMEKKDIGLEVARAAKELTPTPAILILTGFAEKSNTRAALEIGVDYMAHKPVEVKELMSAVNRLILRRGESGSP
jgi:CheY-like chemotaxis protein